jgi:hypothetical protein
VSPGLWVSCMKTSRHPDSLICPYVNCRTATQLSTAPSCIATYHYECRFSVSTERTPTYTRHSELYKSGTYLHATSENQTPFGKKILNPYISQVPHCLFRSRCLCIKRPHSMTHKELGLVFRRTSVIFAPSPAHLYDR